MAIDGLLILDLTEEDLLEELNISTKLHRRKILKGIFSNPQKNNPIGIDHLREYAQYIEQQKACQKNNLAMTLEVGKQNLIHQPSEEIADKTNSTIINEIKKDKV